MYNPEYDTKEERLTNAMGRYRRSLYGSIGVAAMTATADILAVAVGATHRLELSDTPTQIGVFCLGYLTMSVIEREFYRTHAAARGYYRARRLLRVEQERIASHIPLTPSQLIHGDGFTVIEPIQK